MSINQAERNMSTEEDNLSSAELMKIATKAYREEKDLLKANEYIFKSGFRWSYDSQCYVPIEDKVNANLYQLIGGLRSSGKLHKNLIKDPPMYLEVLEKLKDWQVIPSNIEDYDVGYEHEKQSRDVCERVAKQTQQAFADWYTKNYALYSNDKYEQYDSIIEAYESGDKKITESEYLDAVNAKLELESGNE